MLYPALRMLAGAVVVAATLASGSPALSRGVPDGLAPIAVAELPPEAREVLARIEHGGPFRHERDGVSFGNRERILPAKPRGYYLEYTVHTPGERSRGPRRIVCGGAATAPDACFYTDDHYQSFRWVAR